MTIDLVEIFDAELYPQGSEQWHELRRSHLTASNFDVLLRGADSKTRTQLLYRLAGEALSGKVAETYENDAMRRGRAMEAPAVAHYAFTRNVEPERIGFIRRTVNDPLHQSFVIGCSPDALIGDDGALEVKTMKPELLVALIEGKRFPKEHTPQIQGVLWASDRKWCDLILYYEGFPKKPTFHFVRDEAYIAELRNGAERFCWELKQIVQRIQR